MTLLGELVDVNPATHEPASGGPVAVISMADVDSETATASPRIVGHADDAGSAQRAAAPGDVLFARISPSMENGKVAIVPPVEADRIVVSGELLVLRPKAGVDARVVWTFLRQESVRAHLRRFMTGSTGQQRLRGPVLERLEVAAGSEALVATTLDCLERLDRAMAKRRAALAAIEALPATVAARAAEGARRVPLAEFGAELDYGTSERAAEVGEIPVLRIPNVVDGRIDTSDLRYMPAGVDGSRHAIGDGDLLFVRTNGNPARLGRAAVYEGSPPSATFASYLIRLRRNARLDPDFAWSWLRTAEARARLLSMARTTAGQYNLNTAALKELPVPVLPRDTQEQIATAARGARQAADLGSRQLELLGRAVQGVLGMLFSARPLDVEGELVSADPVVATTAILRGASASQQDAWRRVATTRGAFRLYDLPGVDSERAALRHALSIFETAGLVIRERVDDVDQWRLPEADVELVG